MKIKKYENYYTSENTYVVYNEKTKNGFIIDPGYDAEEIIKEIKEIKIKYVLLTHCHFDHMEYVNKFIDFYLAKLICSEKTNINIKDPYINLSEDIGGEAVVLKEADFILKDGEEINSENIKIKCIYTPGHTNGSVCYLVNNSFLFSGDTLFFQNCGRWDLPTGREEDIIKSIKEKIYKLNDEVIVYPGHGKETKIGYEKKFNMIVKAD